MRQFSNFNSKLCLSFDLNILFIGSTKVLRYLFLSYIYIYIYVYIVSLWMLATYCYFFQLIKIKLKKIKFIQSKICEPEYYC